MQAYPDNTGDPVTVPDQVETLRQRFGFQRVVLVGDRGLLTETRIRDLKRHQGLGWSSALRHTAIRQLVETQAVQLSLFDERHLAEIRTEAYPGERLVVCYNPMLAEYRWRKREDLLAATEEKLAKIAREVAPADEGPVTGASDRREGGSHQEAGTRWPSTSSWRSMTGTSSTRGGPNRPRCSGGRWIWSKRSQ